MQFGTNYLGHFALTARLMPLLRQGMDPRVVQVSGFAHRMGDIQLDDLQLERGYTPLKAYSQSKLAMLIFALELQRRSDNGAWGLLSMAAHPGYARTRMVAKGAGTEEHDLQVASGLRRLAEPFRGCRGAPHSLCGDGAESASRRILWPLGHR